MAFVRAELATIGELFPSVLLLAGPRSSRVRTAATFAAASRSPVDEVSLALALSRQGSTWQVVQGAELDRFVGDAPVLTDDVAPVDQLLNPFG